MVVCIRHLLLYGWPVFHGMYVCTKVYLTIHLLKDIRVVDISLIFIILNTHLLCE